MIQHQIIFQKRMAKLDLENLILWSAMALTSLSASIFKFFH